MKLIEPISKAGLKGLDKYKYNSVDTSPLSKYVMHPFWDATVKVFPKWFAPNVMTFLGFILLVINYALISFYDPHYQVTVAASNVVIPSWVWYFCGISHFLSHTLDGCDGKQARRIKQSSPLGELMDHGLDSMAAWLQMLTASTALGVAKYTWIFYFIHCGVVFAFYCTHWEKYNTGVLFLPWAYDFSQILVTLVYLVTGYTGVGLWLTPLGFIHPALETISFLEIFVVVTVLSILYQPIQSLYNIYVSKQHLHTFYNAISPLFPLAAMYGLFTAWLIYSPTDIVRTQTRLIYTCLGLVFSNLTCQVIVSQMTNQVHRSQNVILIPLLPIVLSLYSGYVKDDTLFLFGYLAFTAILHVYYGVILAKSICQHLGIYCFSVTSYPSRKAK